MMFVCDENIIEQAREWEEPVPGFGAKILCLVGSLGLGSNKKSGKLESLLQILLRLIEYLKIPL